MKPTTFLIALAVATAVTLYGCSDSKEQTPPPAPVTPTIVGPTSTPTASGPTPTATISSPDDPLVIIFGDAEPDIGPAPLSVQFSLSDPYMYLIDPEIEWDFGDGSPPSNKRNPKHVYERFIVCRSNRQKRRFILVYRSETLRVADDLQGLVGLFSQARTRSNLDDL